MAERAPLTRLRNQLADALDRAAILLWEAAHHLRPPTTARCPDCGCPLPEGDACGVCNDRQAYERSIMADGYEDGYERGFADGRGEAW